MYISFTRLLSFDYDHVSNLIEFSQLKLDTLKRYRESVKRDSVRAVHTHSHWSLFGSQKEEKIFSFFHCEEKPHTEKKKFFSLLRRPL